MARMQVSHGRQKSDGFPLFVLKPGPGRHSGFGDDDLHG
jgi:hypothetical protein